MAVPSPLHLFTRDTLETAFQHHRQGRFAEAESLYRAVLDAAPGHGRANLLLGILLAQVGRPSDALAFLEFALLDDPDDPDVLINLGNVARMANLVDRAIMALERAVQVSPASAAAYANLGVALLAAGRAREGISALARAVELDPSDFTVRSDLLLALLYDTPTAGKAADEARAFGANFARSPRRRPGRPLRTIAFLSGHFGFHPVGFFLEPLLRGLDRSRYRLVALANQSRADARTAQLRESFDAWCPVQGLPDDALAHLVRTEAIDALIDLEGHTARNRLTALALRLAPVQVNWLGFPGTTGMPFHDVLLGDPTVTPPDEDELATEKVKRLPQSFIAVPFDSLPKPRSSPPCAGAGVVTFGSFNNLAKLSDDAVALWARVMHAVPASRLALKSPALSNPGVAGTVRSRFARHGVHGSRLALWGPVEDRTEHLEAYGEIDVALDTLPYTGATTTVEALSMGVPVVTLLGGRYSARMSASVLRSAGCEDWVAGTEEEYVGIATDLARQARAGFDRRALRERLERSSLGDAVAFSRHFEAALEDAWSEVEAW